MHNSLYTNDEALLNFLNNLEPDWKETQTLSPENVRTGYVTKTTVEVRWSTVDYTDDTGRYIVSYSTTAGGPYTYFGATVSKLVTNLTVTGLEQNTRYYFVVQTQTDSHANNQNIVVSNYSEEVTAIPILDLDDDKMPDDWEQTYFGDLSREGDGDYDNDELSDLEEYTIGTKPDQLDSDDDGINDNDEVVIHGTDPVNSDSDGDDVKDGVEINLNTDPNNSEDYPPHGSITGTIYNNDGSLLTGKSVKVLVQLKNTFIHTSNISVEPSTLSDPDTGTYMVKGIPEDTEYYVAVEDPAHNLTTEYYSGDIDDPSTWKYYGKVLIAVNDGDVITDIDFKLEEAGIISGTIKDLDTSEDLDNINVTAHVSQCGGIAAITYSPSYLGRYTIYGLPLGTPVYLRTGVKSDMNYIDVWYDSDVYIHQCEGAEPVIVGEATIADFYLEQGETISGKVIDKNTREGVMSWVTVYIDPCDATRYKKIIFTSDGPYTIKGLVPGESYYIQSVPSGYVSQWYNLTHIDLCENAAAVQAPSTNIDFEVVIDVDHDKISDEWEIEYFNNLDRDGSADYDSDGLSDLDEYQNGTDPTLDDTDSDGMPDGWEVSYGFNPIGADAGSDYDNDGLSDLEEYQNGTDPTLEDTDSDGIPDKWEVSNNLNPLANDTENDKDDDGYSNLQEYRSGTNPDDINDSPNPPVADAGEDQIDIIEGETVTLFGSNSTDPDDGLESYFWEQIDEGPDVILSDETDVIPTFVTPPVGAEGITLTFKLTVTDHGGLTSDDTVLVTVDDNGITGFPESIVTFSTSTNEAAGCAMVEGGDIVALDIIEPSMITATLNRPENLIYGLIDFNVKTEEVGGAAKITIYLPSPAPAGYSWYKYSGTDGWIDFSFNASFNAERDQVTLIRTDGGTGDDDGVANGIIVDPSGLGSAPVTPVEPDDPEDPPTAGGGGGGGGGGSGIFGNIDLSELTGYHLDWTERNGTAVYMPVTGWIKALKGAQTHVEGFAPGLATYIRENFDELERKAKSDNDGFLSKTGTYLFPVLGKIAELYLYAVDSHELMDNAYKNTTIPVKEFDNLEKQGAAISSHVVKDNSN